MVTNWFMSGELLENPSVETELTSTILNFHSTLSFLYPRDPARHFKLSNHGSGLQNKLYFTRSLKMFVTHILYILRIWALIRAVGMVVAKCSGKGQRAAWLN